MPSLYHLNIPTSSQYITFPIDQKSSVKIVWSEGRLPRSATYYVTKCYWGNLVPGQSQVDPPAGVPNRPRVAEIKVNETTKMADVEVMGQTTLYIASEYIEPTFAGGPMINHHIRNLAMLNGTTITPWITMQLNEFFHYGQNESNGKWNRWIVYHPPIVNSISAPGMYQHRFTGALSAKFAKASIEAMAEMGSSITKCIAKSTSKLSLFGIEIIKGLQGDVLHRFLDASSVAAAAALQDKIDNLKPPSVADMVVTEDRRITAIQYAESQDSKKDNNAVAKSRAARMQEAAKYLEEIRKEDEKNSKIVQKLAGQGGAISAADLNGMNDSDPSDDVVIKFFLDENVGDKSNMKQEPDSIIPSSDQDAGPVLPTSRQRSKTQPMTKTKPSDSDQPKRRVPQLQTSAQGKTNLLNNNFRGPGGVHVNPDYFRNAPPLQTR